MIVAVRSRAACGDSESETMRVDPVTVTVEDAPESDGQLTVTESTVPVNRFVDPVDCGTQPTGAPTTRAAGVWWWKCPGVRVIRVARPKLIRPATGHRHGSLMDSSDVMSV